MPTPLDILSDPISLIILGFFGCLALLEELFPGRPLPRIRHARLRGLAAFATFFFASTYLPLLWDAYLAPYRLVDLTDFAPVAGGFLGLLAYEFVGYGYHRALHRFDGLFRHVHQMHHSAERLDTWSAFYFGPWDMIGWSLMGSIGFVLVVGLSPGAATLSIVAATFLSIFQHANLRTPRWLGYLVQRPESHAVHHARGVHAYNYADLPIVDMLFGTFKNPRAFDGETGYYDGASARVREMILGRDVSRPPIGDASFEDRDTDVGAPPESVAEPV